MLLPTPYNIKRVLRLWDSRLSNKIKQLHFRGRTFEFYETYWWSDASQRLLDAEIAPYFAALEKAFHPAIILDVGAATGQFSILASCLFPRSSIYAFEPAERQRILLSRNMRLNKVVNTKIEPRGLWNSS